MEELMVKEMPVSLDDGDMYELFVWTDPTNEDSTSVKQIIRIMEHTQNLVEVLCERLAIAQGLTGNKITTGPK